MKFFGVFHLIVCLTEVNVIARFLQEKYTHLFKVFFKNGVIILFAYENTCINHSLNNLFKIH